MLVKLIDKLPISQASPYHPTAPTVIELFAGCGGHALGTELAGFNHTISCEQNPVYAYTYNTNLCERKTTILQKDAARPYPNKYNVPTDLDLLTGGPPCQEYSLARGAPVAEENKSNTFFHPITWAEEYKPKCILIENVPNLKYKYEDTLDEFKGRLEHLGYTCKDRIITASDYLVPQSRDRLFVIGVHESISTPSRWFPNPITSESGNQTTLSGTSTYEETTVKDAIDDLPEPLPSQSPDDDPLHDTIADSHISTSSSDKHKVDPHTPLQKIRRDDWTVEAVPPNHIATDHSREKQEKYSQYRLGYMNDDNTGPTERRLDPTKPAPTMTGSNGTTPFHYQGKSPENPDEPIEKVRRLTPREVARIQTFPDNFAAAGTKQEQVLQFANAIPPLLSFILTSHIRSHIINDTDQSTPLAPA